jgi:hypothetical protein
MQVPACTGPRNGAREKGIGFCDQSKIFAGHFEPETRKNFLTCFCDNRAGTRALERVAGAEIRTQSATHSPTIPTHTRASDQGRDCRWLADVPRIALWMG